MKKDVEHFPMRELERRSGFPRATILFYVKEGLLPQPRKTAKNMAVYDQRFVDGLHLIHELKEKYRLSLPQIKDVIQRSTGGVGLELLLDVRDQAFRQLTSQPQQPFLTWEELLAQTDLAPDVLQRLADHHLLIVQPGNASVQYHPVNLVALRLIGQLMDLGFPLEAFFAINTQLSRLADTEVKALMDHTTSSLLNRGAPAQTIIDQSQTGIDLLQSLVALLHVHKLYQVLQSTNWSQYFNEGTEHDNEHDSRH